jgi:glucose-6-phosphate isomerase
MHIKIENGKVSFPFSVSIDLATGRLDDFDTHIERPLSSLVDIFMDPHAAEDFLKSNGDTIAYEVYEKNVPEVNGDIRFCSSITYPGRIGDEYFMTKGHFHLRPDRAELYYCIRGKGYMFMEKKDRDPVLEEMSPGKIVYVPGYYAHRSINSGDEPLISLPVYPADAGHDYKTIEVEGFRHILVSRKGKPTVIENPRYGRAVK